MIDPGDNAHTRWLDALTPGDLVQHLSGQSGRFLGYSDQAVQVERGDPAEPWSEFWLLEDLTQPPHPDLIALAARLPEDL